MSEITKGFYKTKQWRKTQKAFMISKNYICERCGKPAYIVHHRMWLDGSNMHDPDVTLNWDNLEAVCLDCHNKEHFAKGTTAAGLAFNSDGELVQLDPPH